MTSWGIRDSSNGKEKLGHLVHPHCQGMTVPCSVSLPTQLSFQLSFVRWKCNSESHLAMATRAFEDFLFAQKCLLRDSELTILNTFQRKNPQISEFESQ